MTCNNPQKLEITFGIKFQAILLKEMKVIIFLKYIMKF